MSITGFGLIQRRSAGVFIGRFIGYLSSRCQIRVAFDARQRSLRRIAETVTVYVVFDIRFRAVPDLVARRRGFPGFLRVFGVVFRERLVPASGLVRQSAFRLCPAAVFGSVLNTRDILVLVFVFLLALCPAAVFRFPDFLRSCFVN